MKLDELKKKIPDIFEKVKRDVDKVLNRHRAGLSLGLVEMGFTRGEFIGGMFFSGGTMILMNSTALKILISKNEIVDDIVLAYIYHILLHEYIHSLGCLNERECRKIVYYVTKEIIADENDPARIMASRGIGAYFPEINYAPLGYKMEKNLQIERVENFDKSSINYYS
ncbi:MAG: hypothetical protein ACTSRG_14125 [Candidatus Helarchaeota archaeon]